MGNKQVEAGSGGSGNAGTPGEAKLRVYIMTENLQSLEKLVREAPSLLNKRFSTASPAAGLTPLELAASQGLKAVRAGACRCMSGSHEDFM